MAMGMEIYASDGTLQANAEMLSYYCRKSGTGTVQSTASAPLTYGNTVPATMTVPVSGLGYTYPLVAVSCSGYYVARGMNALGGDFRFATDAPAGTSFSYYIFDYSPALPASSFGIELYNASGQRTFSSNYHPMQVLDVLTTGSATHTGKMLAAGLPECGGFRIAGGVDYYGGSAPLWVPVPDGDPYTGTGYQNNADLYGARISNSGQTITHGSVSFDDVYFGPFAGDITVSPDFDTPCRVLAVDVTNIPANTTFF